MYIVLNNLRLVLTNGLTLEVPKIFSKEEPSLKVVSFAESVCKNQSKFQMKENCRSELGHNKLSSIILSRVVFNTLMGKFFFTL